MALMSQNSASAMKGSSPTNVKEADWQTGESMWRTLLPIWVSIDSIEQKMDLFLNFTISRF